jgi:MFS family permease
MALSRYRVVLARPHVLRLLLTSMLARLPQGMSGLAVLLLLTPHVGYARAGFATGVSVAAAGVSNVVLARAVDRFGARPVLIPSALLYAAGMVGLAASAHRSYPAQLAICAIVGLVTPPISSVARGLWPRLLGDHDAQVVYGLEATAQELIFICGPASVALIAGLANARVAVTVSGLVGLVGVLAFVSAPPLGGSAGSHREELHRRSLLRTAVLGYALVGVCLTCGLSMTEIATVDFVGGRQASAAAGLVLAVWSVGSMVGGVLFGASSERVSDHGLTRGVTITAAGLVLAALAPGPAGLAVILLFSGVAVAPTLARLYTRMGAAAPEASPTEAFGWLAVGFLTGSFLGLTIGGAAVDAVGPRWTFVCAGLVALGAGAVITAKRAVASSGVR